MGKKDREGENGHGQERHGREGGPEGRRGRRKTDVASQGHRRRALPDREAVRQGHDHEARPEGGGRGHRGHPDRLDLLRPGPGHRRLPAGPRRRDLRPRGHGQDDPGPPRHRRGPEARRPGGLHRRRARPLAVLRRPDRDRHRQPAHLPARLRGAGPGDRRGPRPQRRGRRHRRRLRGRPRPQGRARGRDGRLAHGPPGAADVPGPAQADGHRRPLEDLLHLHQPDPGEDRHLHRQSRDDDRAAGP